MLLTIVFFFALFCSLAYLNKIFSAYFAKTQEFRIKLAFKIDFYTYSSIILWTIFYYLSTH